MSSPKQGAAAVAIAVVFLAGATASAPRTVANSSRVGPVNRSAIARPVPPHHGHERFLMTSRALSPLTLKARGSGALSLRGLAVAGPLIGKHRRIVLQFRHGSIRLATKITSQWASAVSQPHCRFTAALRGTYKVRGGTKRFSGATGDGVFVYSMHGRLARGPGSCRALLVSLRTKVIASGVLRW